ncbi:TRAP transporter small permease [Salinarimonas sp.]|uniref:TRAP transporter small permease n=1 Tax=Salinarimonas sp. TaxID=2766526 RepID=UPI00391DF82A
MIARVVGVLDRILLAILDAFTIAVAGLLLVLLNWAVFARFVLNSSVSWSEELPAHLLAALTFVGAAYLTRTNEHLGFDSVVRMLPRAAQKAVFALNLVLMGAFAAMLAYFGTIAAMSFGWRLMISVDLPVVLFRGALPLGGALICAICAVRLAGLLTGRLEPQDLMPETDH